MKFLANENVAGDAVVALREKGYDVVWIRTDAPGSNDADVIARAMAEQRILITFDKDFGELAFRSRLPAACGIVLFRIPASSSASVATAVVAAIEARTDWSGHFSVIDENKIRMREL